jgi:hypothetical protein
MEFETPQYEVNKHIVFNNTEVIMTNKFSPIKFIQLLQTGQIIFEV